MNTPAATNPPLALPTPYDISVAPYFPYGPSVRDWLLLLFIGLVVFLLIKALGNRKKRARGVILKVAFDSLTEARRECTLEEAPLNRQPLGRVVLNFRRALGVELGVPGEALVVAELPDQAPFYELKQLLLTVEAIAYGANLTKGETIAALLTRLDAAAHSAFGGVLLGGKAP